MIAQLGNTLIGRIKSTYNAGLISKQAANIAWQDMKANLLAYKSGKIGVTECQQNLNSLISRYGIL